MTIANLALQRELPQVLAPASGGGVLDKFTSIYSFDDSLALEKDDKGTTDLGVVGTPVSATGTNNGGIQITVDNSGYFTRNIDMTQDFSWSFWFMGQVEDFFAIIFRLDVGTFGNDNRVFLNIKDTPFEYKHSIEIGNTTVADVTKAYTESEWWHYAGSWDSVNEQMTIWVNTVKDYDAAQLGTGVSASAEVMRRSGGNPNAEFFIDELYIADGQTLTQQDVDDLYNGGAGLFF